LAKEGQGEAIHDYEGLRTALVARQGSLSRRLAQVARFCLDHPEEVAINGLVKLADFAQVPPTTITRFAKELGFSGFADFQMIFRERLLGPRPAFAARISALDTSRAALSEADLDLPGRVFDSFVQSAVSSLLRIEESIDRGSLDAFVASLAACEAVHIAAARGAFGIGAYALYGFANVGKRAHLIDNLGAMRAEQVAAMGADDAALVLTFDDYTPETIDVAARAAGAGRTVLAITDNELSPVVRHARHVLYVPEARLGHFRSQVPALVVCQALIVSLGRRIGGSVAEKSRKPRE
jgi:DNA-binding MurR/RpiR family transcriptional regulator